MRRYSICASSLTALGVASVIVWWILDWAFGHLLYVAVSARLETALGITDAQMIAILAQHLVPLVAAGGLAALAYAVGIRHGHQSAAAQGAPKPSIPPLAERHREPAIPQRREPILAPPQPGSQAVAGPQSAMRVSCGEDGLFCQTKARNIYGTERTLRLRVDNIHEARAITDIKVAVLAIEPQTEYTGPWVLESGFTLAAGDHRFVPLARYGEASRAPYTTSVYDRSDTFLEILAQGMQPKPSKEGTHFITLRVTGVGSAPYDYRCKVWVDRADGRLRIADQTVSPRFETGREYTTRSPEYLLALYVGKTALQADHDMEPFKGMWMKTEGEITFLASGGAGPVCMLRRGTVAAGCSVECHFSNEWTRPLGRYNQGETLRVEGKISRGQQGRQLYLEECEISNH